MTKQAVGIIGAMEPEVELLKNAMFINKEEQIAHAKAYIGRLEGQDIVLVQSGIGKVNASIITALLLERYDIKCVINTGVAGAMGENLKVTDMVVSEEVVHHDVDATTFGYKYGQVPGMPAVYETDAQLATALAASDRAVHRAAMGSGEKFVTADLAHALRTDFSALWSIDMETAAIAQAAHNHGARFAACRAISDLCAPDSAEFDTHIDDAAERSAHVVIDALARLAA